MKLLLNKGISAKMQHVREVNCKVIDSRKCSYYK